MNKFKVLGWIAIIMGFLAMLAPMVTGMSIVFLVGILVVIAGIARLIWAVQARSMGKMLLMLVIGVLTLICGLMMLANPLFAAAVMTILLAAYFLADGFMELSVGIAYINLPGRGWLIFAGIVSILLGIMIIAQYPLSGVWAIGILFGIKLFFVGIAMIMSGSLLQMK